MTRYHKVQRSSVPLINKESNLLFLQSRKDSILIDFCFVENFYNMSLFKLLNAFFLQFKCTEFLIATS